MSKRLYCQCCGEFVSKSLFYEHQKKYSWDVQFEFTPEESGSSFEFQPNTHDHAVDPMDQQDEYTVTVHAENDCGKAVGFLYNHITQ